MNWGFYLKCLLKSFPELDEPPDDQPRLGLRFVRGRRRFGRAQEEFRPGSIFDRPVRPIFRRLQKIRPTEIVCLRQDDTFKSKL